MSLPCLYSILLLFLACTSCTTGPFWNTPTVATIPPDYRPEFWIEYYPYPCWQEQNTLKYARPVPNYNGWTDVRMERDLARLSEAGFQAVLLFFTPEQFAKKTTLERTQRFYDLAAALEPPIRVAIVLAPMAKKFSLRVANTMNFFQQQGLADKVNALKFEDTAILFFDHNVTLLGQYRGALGYIRFGDFWPARSEFSGNPRSPVLRRGFTWVTVADNGGNAHLLPKYTQRWPIPRDRGEHLAAALQQALANRAEIICLSSWNNFNRASFMEPNSLEYDLFFTVFRENTDFVKSAAAPRPTLGQ